MRSRRSSSFRRAFARLPRSVQQQARRKYRLFRSDPYHNSLSFKQVDPSRPIYSVRIGEHYRALGERHDDEITWFWIGTHAEYDKLLSQR